MCVYYYWEHEDVRDDCMDFVSYAIFFSYYLETVINLVS